MNLMDLSIILIGKISKRKTVSLFFPNIPSRNINVLDISIKSNDISDSTLSRIINLSYAKNLRTNCINTTFIDKITEFTKNGDKLNVINQMLRVDYLIVPPVSNKRLVHYFNKNNPNETIYYDQYLT